MFFTEKRRIPHINIKKDRIFKPAANNCEFFPENPADPINFGIEMDF